MVLDGRMCIIVQASAVYDKLDMCIIVHGTAWHLSVWSFLDYRIGDMEWLITMASSSCSACGPYCPHRCRRVRKVHFATQVSTEGTNNQRTLSLQVHLLTPQRSP